MIALVLEPRALLSCWLQDPSLQPPRRSLQSDLIHIQGQRAQAQAAWLGRTFEGACGVLAVYLGLEQEPRRVLKHSSHWLPLVSLGAPGIMA